MVKKLDLFEPDDFKVLVSGYTSTRKHVVEKIDTGEAVTVTLKLTALAEPYVKAFPLPPGEMLSHYRQVVEQRLSFGAYQEARLVGVAIAERRSWNRSLWLWEIVVEQAHQRAGIGKQLIEAVSQAAKEAGLRVVVCETQNTNMPAIGFYRKNGFEIDGIDLSYYTNTDVTAGEVALFMKKKLE